VSEENAGKNQQVHDVSDHSHRLDRVFGYGDVRDEWCQDEVILVAAVEKSVSDSFIYFYLLPTSYAQYK